MNVFREKMDSISSLPILLKNFNFSMASSFFILPKFVQRT